MFKSNYLVELTILLVTAKCLLFSVINIGNRSCLCISTVMYGYINIRITKVNDFAVCSLNICCVTSKQRTINVFQCLACNRHPSDIASNVIFDATFSKADCLLAVAWCLWAVIHDIVNSHINIIFATAFTSAMLQVNIENIVAVISLILIAIKVIWNQLIAFFF